MFLFFLGGTDQFAAYKRLDGGVYFIDNLPMTPSGKIVRVKAKEIAQNLYQSKKDKQKRAKL